MAITGRIQKFDSMLDFTNQVKLYRVQDNPNASSKEGDKAWAGTDTFGEAVELAENGWRDGLKKIKKAIEDLEALPAIEMLPVFDVCGEAFNLDAVLQGQPENMFYFMPQESNKPRVISISFAFNFKAKTKSSEIIKRGAAIASAVNDLENQGLRVELYAHKLTVKPGNAMQDGLFTIIKVKDADQHLDLERLVYIAAHPSMNRRLGFRLCEQYNNTEFAERIGSDYGNAKQAEDHDFESAGIHKPCIIQQDHVDPVQIKSLIQDHVNNIQN
jgi:hypothetical protein